MIAWIILTIVVAILGVYVGIQGLFFPQRVMRWLGYFEIRLWENMGVSFEKIPPCEKERITTEIENPDYYDIKIGCMRVIGVGFLFASLLMLGAVVIWFFQR